MISERELCGLCSGTIEREFRNPLYITDEAERTRTYEWSPVVLTAMSTTTGVGRVDFSSRSFGVAIGDAALIGLFVLAGELSHYSVGYLGSHPERIVGTALPFYIGWIIAALVLGAYSHAARESPKRAALVAGGTWILAAVIGQALRATSVFHGDFAVTFVLVSIGVGLVLLVPWRIAVSIW